MPDVKTFLGAVCVSGALLLSGAAMGAQWETVARTSDESIFVDLESLRLVGSHVEAQGMHSYVQSRNLGQDWYVHRSRLMTYRFDCGAEMLAYTSFEMKSGELGSGETVYAGSTGGDLFPAASHPLDLKLMGKVCSPANLARAERQASEKSRLASR